MLIEKLLDSLENNFFLSEKTYNPHTKTRYFHNGVFSSQTFFLCI